MADSTTLLKAFEEGEKKLHARGGGDYQAGARNRPMSGNVPPVLTGVEYDPTGAPPNALTSLNVDPRLKPGQFFNQMGTTVMNPLRSSKEVEAVLGEKKYNPKVEEKSPEQMRVKQVELENQVDSLSKQVNILIAALNKQTGVTKTVELEDMTVTELRNMVKEKSLHYVGRNKEQLIETLRNANTVTENTV